MLKLKIESRESGSKRQAGFVPAVVYGPKTDTVSISIPEAELNKVWKSAGESTVITLEGAAGNHDVLIHDIARDPVSDVIIHVDFYAVDKNKTVHINVPLEFVGTAPAVKEKGAVLVKVLHELSIEALPKDLPHGIEVDISSLTDINSQIKAQDVKLPHGVTLNMDPEEVLILASVAKEEEAEEASTVIDMDAIGLSEKKGKKEDDEAAE